MKHTLTRRDFIKGATVFSAIGVAPQFLTDVVYGASPLVNGDKDGRILVVVQLSGGNDGLNTVVPYSDDAYYRARPHLALKRDQILTINNDVGLHYRLKDLARLYDDGQLAIIQGVGYPNPDRSHFRSMEIWHTASDSDEYLSRGWIGRYFDNNCSGSTRPQVGVALGNERPQAFEGERGLGIAFTDPQQYGWRAGKGRDNLHNFNRLNAQVKNTSSSLDFLQHVTSDAILSSHEVHKAAERIGGFSGNWRGDPLLIVSQLIRADLQTRIYYVSFGSFDTHTNQISAQRLLLERFGKSLGRFQDALRQDGNAGRVLTMVFSEFGRRVTQNASGGTDHGTAAPMFLAGDNVRPGLHGAQPSLTDLDHGDLKFSTDFRSVYATILKEWFKVDTRPVLYDSFPTMELIT